MRYPRIEWRPDSDGSRGGRFWDLEGDFEVMPQEVAAGYDRMVTVLNDPDPGDARSEGSARRLCLPCVRCGVELQPVFLETAQDGARTNPDPPRAQPLDATTMYGVPAYGSDHDLQGSGPQLVVNLCDDCLTVVGRRGRVNLVREKRTTKPDYYSWKPDTP